MAEPFKNIYSQDFFHKYTNVLERILPAFNIDSFFEEIYDGEWEERELKQRMRHISNVLREHLSSNYKEAVNQLIKSIDLLIEQEEDEGIALGRLEYIFITDYIEQNGIDDFETSIKAFEVVTQFSSCEFGVRPFIIKYEQKMLNVMYQWAHHKNEKVRRLASEGCRPRLPWAMAIPALKKNPNPLLPILEALKNDPSPYVRKSVANNLNDISKDNPDFLVQIAKRWIGDNKETDWIIKHACRTLLKEGNQDILQLFGFGAIDNIEINNFKLTNEQVRISRSLEFTFDLINQSNKNEKLRLEYGVYYMKQNGSLSRKVYKISEKEYKANSTTHISRKQSFKLISTRKLHLGQHQVSLIINGVEIDVREFELTQ